MADGFEELRAEGVVEVFRLQILGTIEKPVSHVDGELRARRDRGRYGLRGGIVARRADHALTHLKLAYGYG